MTFWNATGKFLHLVRLSGAILIEAILFEHQCIIFWGMCQHFSLLNQARKRYIHCSEIYLYMDFYIVICAYEK